VDSKKKTDIWLDTDIGGDIDDALALALILKSPEVNLLGVTTSFNCAEQKARIARRMTELAGRDDIPVFYGQDRPILSRRELIPPCQYDEATLGSIAVKGNGVEETAHAILAHEGKVTMVCIGSLTDLALMLMLYPATADKLEQILIMGGNFYQNMIESNIIEDPLAADYVFRSGLPLIAVGTDVTDRCQMTREDVETLRQSDDPVCRFVCELMNRWEGYLPVIHDPLAVMYLLKPEVLTMQKEEVVVATEGEVRGFTYNVSLRRHLWGGEAEHPNVLAAIDVRPDEAVRFLMERLCG